MTLNQCSFETSYLSQEQHWMLEAILPETATSHLPAGTRITDAVIEDLFETDVPPFFLFRKDGNAYLASDNTEILRSHFCAMPQTIAGKELLSYGVAAIEQAVEKVYVKVPNRDGVIVYHMPATQAGHTIRRQMEEIGLQFSTIFKPRDSTPRLFTDSGSWKGSQIAAFLKSFA